MEIVAIFVIMAVTVEAIVEYAANLLEHEEKRVMVLQLCALAVAVALCCTAGLDVYEVLGVGFGVPYVGCVLTGIFASRGANYANDIIGRLRGSST